MSASHPDSSSVHRRLLPLLARVIAGQGLASGLAAAGLLTLAVALFAPSELSRAQDSVGSVARLFWLGPAIAVLALAIGALLLVALTLGRARGAAIAHLVRIAGWLGVLAPPAYSALLFTGWNGRLHAGVWLGSMLLVPVLLAIGDRLARSKLTKAAESKAGLLLMSSLTAVLALVGSLGIRNTDSPIPLENGLPTEAAKPWQLRPQRSESAPQLVLMISVDTLRADHMSVYGYPRSTTPTLERVAAQGVLFERVIAASSGSRPALATLLTGRAPRQHGVLDQRGGLNPAIPTLAEIFSTAGFDTVAVVVNPVVEDSARFQRGFRHFETFDELPADQAAAHLLDALPARRDVPVFAWLHLYEPHTPYSPPRELTVELLADEHYDSERLDPIEYGSYGGIRRGRTLGSRRTGTVRDLEKGYATALYDGEILAADLAIGRFLDDLERSYAPADTVLLFTADHGEVLVPARGDLFFQHALEVRQSAIRVPGLLWAPGRLAPGEVRRDLVCQQDLPPALIRLAELPADTRLASTDISEPEGALQGCASQTAWWDDLSLRALPRGQRAPTYALVEDRWKLIARFQSDFEAISGPLAWLGAWRSTFAGLWKRDELFDLLRDPEERVNRLETEPRIAAEMRSRLLARLQSVAPPDTQHRDAGDTLRVASGSSPSPAYE